MFRQFLAGLLTCPLQGRLITSVAPPIQIQFNITAVRFERGEGIGQKSTLSVLVKMMTIMVGSQVCFV